MHIIFYKPKTLSKIVFIIKEDMTEFIDGLCAVSLSKLKTADGDAVSIQYVSVIPNAAGQLRVLLSIDTDYYYYGEVLQALELKTGYEYLSALVLPKNALYQKVAGEDEPWYVYKVRADGEAIGEIEVTIGYNNGAYVCVSGIQAGEYFDTGYGAIKGES